jgi:methylmalonyl-CoA/ethylmalonyl-CoA epimerase
MFQRVHHLAFLVGDLDAAAEQFETGSGLDPLVRREMTGDFELEVILYPVGESLVELITPTTESGWVYDTWQATGDGFFHVAFEVDDVEASMRELESRGVDFQDVAPREGFDWIVATLDDADTLVPMQLVEDPRTPEERIAAFG